MECSRIERLGKRESAEITTRVGEEWAQRESCTRRLSSGATGSAARAWMERKSLSGARRPPPAQGVGQGPGEARAGARLTSRGGARAAGVSYGSGPRRRRSANLPRRQVTLSSLVRRRVWCSPRRTGCGPSRARRSVTRASYTVADVHEIEEPRATRAFGRRVDKSRRRLVGRPQR